MIVKVKDEEEKTVGGIVLASNAKKKPTEGEVVAVGEGAYASNGEKIPMSVKKGDVVLYDRYSGTNVEYEGEKYLVLHEKDILAIAK
ncbi:co-chaperonin GroES [Lactobacillus helveticus DSM 20075 = CGMCC 1.1877]|nr:co-chaperonin GroES [Lactobacillus helveticus DSM 20075 = CGMCC 1.1877]